MAQVLIPLGLLWTVTYFFELNDRLASWSVLKKSLAFFTCCSSPRPCHQLCIHCLLACVQWMEWSHSQPQSLQDLNYSLFILFLLMLFLLISLHVQLNEWKWNMHMMHSILLFGTTPHALYTDFVISVPKPYFYSAPHTNQRQPGQHSGSPGHVFLDWTLWPSRFDCWSALGDSC